MVRKIQLKTEWEGVVWVEFQLTMDLDFVSLASHEGALLLELRMFLHDSVVSESKERRSNVEVKDNSR